MHAIILAAGVGQRLSAAHQGPKCLIEFDGQSLLQRHITTLASLGVDQLTLVLGYQSELITDHLADVATIPTLVHYNPLYRLGSMVSLWSARQSLLSGDDVLIMDADVLYQPQILQRLIDTPLGNAFLLDRDFIDGEEPVKICLKNNTIVEFRKQLKPALQYDQIGESVGFFKFEPVAACELYRLLAACVADQRRELPHEEALRSLALDGNADIGIVDVSGMAWIEIDFPQDLSRANDEILPLIKPIT